MSNHCIWAILSIGELNFVNTSSIYENHLLKDRSLYQLIHPEEVALAKRDLTIFMNSNMIGGSVTRCRLKDYTTTNIYSWIVVDIIMYIATKDLVLAFFHHPSQEKQACGNDFIQQESRKIIGLLRDRLIESYAHSPSLSFTSTSTSSVEEGLPNQFFHILDNHSKSVLLSWPDQYYYPNDASLLDNRPMSPTISCFRCVQQPAKITLLGEKMHQIMIDYGSITFVLVYIEKIQSLPSPPCSRNRRSSPYSLPVNNSNKQQQYPCNQRNHCHSCGTDSSPEWRRGPTGHKTLCNACGLRYSRSIARQGKHHLKKHYKQSIQFAIS